MAVKTIFLDRDGVVNRRILDGYVTTIQDLEILEGVPEGLGLLSKAGYRLVVITNQRGIALGLYDEEDLKKIHNHLSEVLLKEGVNLVEFYFCPHDRHDHCGCRKPLPGLIDQAAATRNILWSESYLIGDSDSDLLAGMARDLRVIKIGKIESVIPNARYNSLFEAAKAITDSA